MTVDFSVNVSGIRLREIRDATAVDTKMDILKSYILNGWPERNKMASELTIYHNMRDILSYEDGILLKGEAILIPSALRGDITKRLHSAHMGYNSMIRRARSLVYWPSMSRDIKQVVDTCAPCQELRPHNQKETLKIQDDGNGPWDKVSSDLFEI